MLRKCSDWCAEVLLLLDRQRADKGLSFALASITGAVVKRMSMRDIRTLAAAPKAWVSAFLVWSASCLLLQVSAATRPCWGQGALDWLR